MSEACRVLHPDGESPVAENITSLHSNLNSMGHVESCVNQQGPPYKAKYSWVTDNEVVPIFRNGNFMICWELLMKVIHVLNEMFYIMAFFTNNLNQKKQKKGGCTGEPHTLA